MNRALFALLLFAIPFQKDKPKDTSPLPSNISDTSSAISAPAAITFTSTMTSATMVVLSRANEPLVIIDLQNSGEIVYGKNYTPDAAAKAFWQAIGTQYPCHPQPAKPEKGK